MICSAWVRRSTAGMACALVASVSAHAQTREFNIAGGELKTALEAYVLQSGVQLVYRSDDIQGLRSKGATGKLSVEGALDVLLDGTSLKVRREPGNAVVIFRSSASSAETQSAELSSRLDTVIVTAQKRPQTLLDVPSSLVAMSGERASELGITDFVSLSQYTPGVVASNQLVGGRTVQTFTIRGIGNDDFRPNGSPSAAVHFDGVYQGSSALVGGQMFDVERIEVLKGPQGTLYGRNTTAGAINVISRKPGEALGGQASVELGSYGSARTELALGGPIDDRWGFRIAAVYDRTDGFQTNLGSGKYGGTTPSAQIPKNPSTAQDDHSAGTDFTAVRSLVSFNPVPGTKLLFNLHGFHESGGTQLAERTLPSGRFAINEPYTVDANLAPSLLKNSTGTSLTVDQELPGEMLLSVVGGYERVGQRYTWNEGQPIRYFDIAYADRVEQHSIEARLRNNDDGQRGLDWVLGGIYFSDKVGMVSDLDASDFLRTVFRADYRQTRDSWAVFGDVSKTLAQRWTLGLGLRYTDERSDFSGSSIDLNPYGTTLSRLAFPKVPVYFSETFKDGRWSGKGTLSYRPAAQTMFYGSIGQGFKAGGFDGSTITSVEEARPFRSETVTSYETGVKFLPNGPVQIDASVFYYDYTDMQSSSVRNIAGVLTNVRTNVGKAHITGAELNVLARPLRGLDLILGLSRLESKITDIASDDPVERARRLSARLPNTPRYTASATARYQYQLGGDASLVSSLSGRWIGHYFGELDNFQSIGGDFVGDARMELKFGSRWSVAAWVKNLSDSRRFTGVGAVTAITAPLFRAAPRTVGVTASLRY